MLTTLDKWMDFKQERAKEIQKYETLRRTHINSLKTIEEKLQTLYAIGTRK